MNTLMTIYLSFLLFLMSLADSESIIPNGTLSYIANGISVTSTRTQAILMPEDEGQTLIINANSHEDNLNRTLGISIKEAFTGVGSYTIGTISCGSKAAAMMNEISNDFNHIYQSLHCDGTLNVIEHNIATQTISGSFNMTLTHSDDGTEVTITNGEFSQLPLTLVD